MKDERSGFKDILLTGGARSGKSRFAQELGVKSGKQVLFVATAEAGDEEMRRRIAEHRRHRPAAWQTLEMPRAVGQSLPPDGYDFIIVDCITMLVNNVFNEFTGPAAREIDAGALEKAVNAEIQGLLDAMARIPASFVIVTNEVGLGIVPGDRLTRLYRDLLGSANQVLAQNVNEVYWLAAGIPVRIKP